MRSAVESETLGRDAERAELARVLDVVADGPVALLLEGEAGIGKTTVWRDGIALAAEQGFRVLACAPAELERDLPFAALDDCLEPVLDEALPSLSGALRSALEVALLRGDATARVPDQRAVSVASLAVVRSLATAGQIGRATS